MQNYYQMLNVAPSASDPVIRIALDQIYNEMRRLVTHHDPQVVQNANQNLLAIETARGILLNPVKRANYDAELGLGNVGGVADPTARGPVGTPFAAGIPAAPALRAVAPGMAQVAGWLCPKCNSISPVGTKYCKKCGNVLGKNCPKCNVLMEPSTQFCPECGTNVREYEREMEVQTAELERNRHAEEKRKAEIEARLGPVIQWANNASSMMKVGCVVGFFLSIIGFPFWIISIINARKVLSAAQVPGDTEYRQKAKTAQTISGIAVGVLGTLFVLVVGFYAIGIIGAVLSGGQ